MIDGKRFTTINTDAGIKDSIAAYAYWIRSEDVQLRGSKRFKNNIINSAEAEIAAIISALYIVAQNNYLRTADVIVCNCDNKGALNTLRYNKFNGWSKRFEPWYNKIRDNIKSPIYFKHVKGHYNNGEPRNFVNNWCDKEIRKHYKT